MWCDSIHDYTLLEERDEFDQNSGIIGIPMSSSEILLFKSIGEIFVDMIIFMHNIQFG